MTETPETLDLNEALIQQYVDNRRADLLITLFQSLKDSRDRAEFEVRAHLHTIKRLSESFKSITEPNTGTPVGQRAAPTVKATARTPTKPPTKPNPISTSSLAVDIDL